MILSVYQSGFAAEIVKAVLTYAGKTIELYYLVVTVAVTRLANGSPVLNGRYSTLLGSPGLGPGQKRKLLVIVCVPRTITFWDVRVREIFRQKKLELCDLGLAGTTSNSAGNGRIFSNGKVHFIFFNTI